jgi:hypothetical protein
LAPPQLLPYADALRRQLPILPMMPAAIEPLKALPPPMAASRRRQ